MHPLSIHAITARVARYICLGAATTALTHLAMLVPVLRWAFVMAAVVGIGWIAIIALSYWAAHTRHPVAWFEHTGDFIDVVGPTAAMAIAVFAGLLLGAPLSLLLL